ncbi:hypothetical protein PGQ11_009973 [Apiospora arundinis]|uniref:Uncharacterized protein n=1 Tax=Apiospora arundinis TaxID=335852 RepID=A0ABR2I893_9PEZI
MPPGLFHLSCIALLDLITYLPLLIDLKQKIQWRINEADPSQQRRIVELQTCTQLADTEKLFSGQAVHILLGAIIRTTPIRTGRPHATEHPKVVLIR